MVIVGSPIRVITGLTLSTTLTVLTISIAGLPIASLTLNLMVYVPRTSVSTEPVVIILSEMSPSTLSKAVAPWSV